MSTIFLQATVGRSRIPNQFPTFCCSPHQTLRVSTCPLLASQSGIAPDQVKDDKSPGGSHRIQRYVALHWHSLCLRTWQNALSSQNLRELCSGLADAEEISAVLSSHFKFLTATLRRFLEFGLLYRHFPWRFFCLCDESPQVAQDTMADMKAEWQLLMKLEAVPGASATWPLKSVPIVRWQVYREVMTFAEERHWQVTKDLTDLISAWCADPSSTLGCEEVFRHLRLAERRHTSSSICVPQIQAVAIKGLNERYQKFETQPLEAEAISSVPVGSVIKPGIWSAERDSASDTGICRFNQLARSTVVSPHYLQRRSLNIWSTLKTQGDLTDSWTSELVRPGQAEETWVKHCFLVRLHGKKKTSSTQTLLPEREWHPFPW